MIGAGADLLPAVANPKAEIAPDSKLQSVGKVPSRYNSRRQVVGIAQWTKHQTTLGEIERWKQQPDYALAVQTRGIVKAIDIDVDDPVKSAAIREAITEMIGPCPVRYRDNSGRLLIPIRYEEPLPKRVLPVHGGMIEILGDGQQFIADGLHPSGSRYKWNGTTLPEMPVLDSERLEALCSMLELCFGTDDWKISRERREGKAGDLIVHDDVADWLVDNWETYDVQPSGQINIQCPFSDLHTGDSGQSATSYFPAGTGGYHRGHFVCLHAHCTGRSDNEFLGGVGYNAALFADLVPQSIPDSGGDDDGGRTEQWPRLVRDKQQRIEPSADNLVKLLSRPDLIGRQLAFDEFKDELIWAPAGQDEQQWRVFTDTDYIDVRIELERRGMKAMSQELLRSAVQKAGCVFRIDTAQVWLKRLRWDGVERVEAFCASGWGWATSEYSAAVGRYIWTAMAGRVLEPGCQCDMAPILVSPQGAGKTSAIKAMVPDETFYTTIPLDGHDDDTSRRLRGKLVGELEELRGLNSRHIEEIKAWITRTSEEWVPKYKEFASKFKRRLLFFGSTNDEEFLNDPTGERRWLPGRCGLIDIEWIKANREQLWAEGAAKFMLGGVAWEEAVELGQHEHHEFKVSDSWEPSVERWLNEPQISGQSPSQEGQVTIGEVLSGAVNIPVAQHDRSKVLRMAKVLKGLGWERRQITQGDRRVWFYVRV